MKCFKRNELYSEIRDPQPSYFLLQGDFRTYVRYYLTATISIPWYAYLIFAAMILGVIMVGEWVLALIILGVCILIILGLALFTASSFQKIADKGTYIGFDENGVGYWVPVQDAEEDEEDKEDDDEGKIYVNLAVSAPWYELDEIKVFDSFLMFKFVSTSELGLVFVPLESIENAGVNVDEALENILAYWKQHAQDKPVGQKDRRLIWVIIVIAILALRFILKYLKYSNV